MPPHHLSILRIYSRCLFIFISKKKKNTISGKNHTPKMISIVSLPIMMHSFTHESWHSRHSAYNEVFWFPTHSSSTASRLSPAKDKCARCALKLLRMAGRRLGSSRPFLAACEWGVDTCLGLPTRAVVFQCPGFHRFYLDAGAPRKKLDVRIFGQTIDKLTMRQFDNLTICAFFLCLPAFPILRYALLRAESTRG